MHSIRSSQKPKAPEAPPQPIHQWSFEAIGTHWWIGIYQPVSATILTHAQAAVAARIEAFDVTYSRFRADSLVTRIAKVGAGTYQFPEDGKQLFALYRELHDATGGQVTPLIGQALSDAGYDASYSLQPRSIGATPTWDDVLEVHGTTITVSRPVLLDFGAAGKGYLVDIVSDLLTQKGITAFCVDGGGDMHCQGLAAPLRIGLEHPDDTALAIGVAELQQGALCGSAGNRRAWAGYNHILDPAARSSASNLKAVWVTASSALLADGLTTALYFAEPSVLHGRFSFAHCLIDAHNTIQHSADFRAELFT